MMSIIFFLDQIITGQLCIPIFFSKCIFIRFSANGNQNSQDHCHKNSRGRKGYGIMSQCHSRL